MHRNNKKFLRILWLLQPTLSECIIRTPKVTFISSKAILDANAVLTLSIYTRQTQQSAQLFKLCVSGELDLWHPWSEIREIIVNVHHFFSSWVYHIRTFLSRNYVTHNISRQPTQNITNYYSGTLPTWWGRGLWGHSGGHGVHMDTIIMAQTTECMM